uniref:Sialin n=1 Tax=Ascaris suum TaxID=6253 RepID=F1L297_ASCSU
MENTSPVVCSTRLTLALVSFLGCVCVYMLRNDVSFAIVCMVNSTAVGGGSDGHAGSCKPENNDSESSTNEIEGSLLWSKGTQGSVLSAFFWGYIFSQILGGYIAGRYGGKYVIGVSVLLSSVLNLISPVSANASVAIFIAIRVLLGVSQGVIFPAFHSLWAQWAPPFERSLLTGISYAGNQIGNTIVMPISGVLCQHGFAGGWPSVYYVLGAVGLVWCAIWFFYAADSPTKHRFISKKERAFIEEALHETLTKEGEKKPPIPLKAILKSPAVWGLWAGHFASDWGAYIMAAGLPLFMNDVLGFDLTSMGFLSAIPYLVYFLAINIAGFIADRVRYAGWLSTINVRRLAMIIALGSQAVFLVACGFCGCGQEHLVVIFLTLGIGISGVAYAGFVVNYLDIAPTFAGTILGIGNTITCVAGILCPLIIGWLTPSGSKSEWLVVFWITFAILIAGTVVFLILAKGEVQEWAKVHSSSVSTIKVVINGSVKDTSGESSESRKETSSTIKSGKKPQES